MPCKWSPWPWPWPKWLNPLPWPWPWGLWPWLHQWLQMSVYCSPIPFRSATHCSTLRQARGGIHGGLGVWTPQLPPGRPAKFAQIRWDWGGVYNGRGLNGVTVSIQALKIGSEYTKMSSFQSQSAIFSGEGPRPLPRPSPTGEMYPFPEDLLGAYGASSRPFPWMDPQPLYTRHRACPPTSQILCHTNSIPFISLDRPRGSIHIHTQWHAHKLLKKYYHVTSHRLLRHRKCEKFCENWHHYIVTSEEFYITTYTLPFSCLTMIVLSDHGQKLKTIVCLISNMADITGSNNNVAIFYEWRRRSKSKKKLTYQAIHTIWQSTIGDSIFYITTWRRSQKYYTGWPKNWHTFLYALISYTP